MAELTPSERLQPCLLDRLTDDEPQSAVESRDKRVFSVRQLREAVLRDIAWLLNAPNKDRTGEYEEFPLARASVLNFGLPDLTGLTASAVESGELESLVREAIERFEPRVLPGSLRVRFLSSDDRGGYNTLGLEIAGDMWAQPVPEQLFLKTEVDLETGQCSLTEAPHG
ncbi:MAG: type VI secretion system baseplate subunit TssE [Phycisphaerales bacterium]|nr:MAG: type VI secretion system baseplate subunit TssE [Phycisphaerales bacterium]